MSIVFELYHTNDFFVCLTFSLKIYSFKMIEHDNIMPYIAFFIFLEIHL